MKTLYLVSPYMDKGYSLQVFSSPDVVAQVVEMFNRINYEASRGYYNMSKTFEFAQLAHPFLQGNTREWCMIEFWTKNQDAILKYCEVMSETLSMPLEIVTIQEFCQAYDQEYRS